MRDYIQENTIYYSFHDYDLVMAYSDYAALRQMLGYPKITLDPGQYLLHCRTYLEKFLEKYTLPVSLGARLWHPRAYTASLWNNMAGKSTEAIIFWWCQMLWLNIAL